MKENIDVTTHPITRFHAPSISPTIPPTNPPSNPLYSTLEGEKSSSLQGREGKHRRLDSDDSLLQDREIFDFADDGDLDLQEQGVDEGNTISDTLQYTYTLLYTLPVPC